MSALGKMFFWAALILTGLTLWTYGQAHAAPGAIIRILDYDQYPLVIIQLRCEHDDAQSLVTGCAAVVKDYCPEGATVLESTETPAGAVPQVLDMKLSCRRGSEV